MLCTTSCSLFHFFFFYSSADHRALHSFPTRRSSDLKVATLPVIALGVGIGVDYALYLLSVQLAQQRAGLSLTELEDRKSTRLNSSHLGISYAVFCLKKKKINKGNER